MESLESSPLFVSWQGQEGSPRTVVPQASYKDIGQSALCGDELVLLKDHACLASESAQFLAIRGDSSETVYMYFPAGGPGQKIEAAQERGPCPHLTGPITP